MKSRLIAIFFLAFGALAPGQAPSPELAPITARYQTDVAALDAQQQDALTRAQQPYLAALTQAEKTATTTGDLNAVAAIAREVQAVRDNLMPAVFPTGLPKSLQTPRKSYLDAVAKARAADLAKRKTVDAAYLRGLASLQPKAARNPELAQQIEAEKAKLLSGTIPAGSGSPATPARTSGRNAMVNGSFDDADAEGKPAAWKVPARKEGTATVVREGSNSVVRVTLSGEVKPYYIEQEIPIPPRAKSVTISAKVRGKWEDRDTKDGNWGATTSATFLGADERKFGGWIILVGGREPGWKNLTKSKDIPEGAKGLHVHFGCQFVTGTFDFDEIVAEFR
jgi:hypothetical protein